MKGSPDRRSLCIGSLTVHFFLFVNEAQSLHIKPKAWFTKPSNPPEPQSTWGSNAGDVAGQEYIVLFGDAK